MTRCLDCGAELNGAQCTACGLTPAAAELVFRRRLLVQTAIFLAGSLLFPYVSQVYAPLAIDAMLVFFVMLFFMAFTLVVFSSLTARACKGMQHILHTLPARCPWTTIL